MPPSSVLSTRYRKARRYPVICRGPTIRLCHDIALLLAQCGASASAGATVKWCQFNDDENVQAGYYATREVRRCGKSGILLVSGDSRVTLSKTDRLAFACSRMCVARCYAEKIVLCSKTSNKTGVRITSIGGTVNSYYDCEFPSGSSSSSYPEHRSFSILAAAERKQQVCVYRYVYTFRILGGCTLYGRVACSFAHERAHALDRRSRCAQANIQTGHRWLCVYVFHRGRTPVQPSEARSSSCICTPLHTSFATSVFPYLWIRWPCETDTHATVQIRIKLPFS